MKKTVIGTRGSRLALWQTEFAIHAIQEHFPDFTPEVQVIKTQGDKILDVALAQIGERALFTKELENALREGFIDLAVHSLKDLQSVIPSNLCLPAVLERHDPHDVIVSRDNIPFPDLPPSAVIGTGSPRRRSQLAHLRHDFNFRELRGSIETRLHKLDRGDYDAIVMAKAALDRLGLSHRITTVLPFNLMLPPAGQGTIALEIRANDDTLKEIVDTVNHQPTFQLSQAERTFLRIVQGGCQAPIAAHARYENKQLALYGLISTPDGRYLVREKWEGLPENSEEIGQALAQKMCQGEGRKILDILDRP